MGGMKVWHILILLVLVGMVQATCTNCGATTIPCPSYCSSYIQDVLCVYSSPTALCNNTCINGTCINCTPSCGTPIRCTSCGLSTINCPAAYCNGNSKCTYPATSFCNNTCSGSNVSGTCSNCTPSCTATCTACPSGTLCDGGACTRLPGGSPLIRKCIDPNGCGNPFTEPVEQLPFGGMWAAIVVVIAVIGIGIGYFVVKGAMTATAPKRKRK